jgi:peptide/nickel transport system permease protein
MANYILKRLVQTVIVLLIVSLLCFTLLYLMPGDPVYALYGGEITPEKYQQYYTQMGLDQPLIIRYFKWMGGVLSGDLGRSVKYSEPVAGLIAARLPVTLYMGILALLISTAIGMVFGVLCSTKRGTWVDYVVTVLANLGSAVPLFWLGVLGVFLFSVQFGLLPSFGFSFPWDGDPGLSFRQCILPVFALCVGPISSTTRQLRSSMLEVIRLDFIRSQRAKGLSEKSVIVKHALPNAIIPVVTLIGLHFRQLVAGAVSVEKVFNIPGMGNLLVTAVFSRDVAVTQACILITCTVIGIANLLVDISYCYIDPRIRIQ